MSINAVFKALANDKRIQLLGWLKDPAKHFPAHPEGSFEEDGVCALHIAQKLGVSQPTASVHLGVLTRAGLLKTKRVRQWTYYRRDERRITELKRLVQVAL